MGQSTNFPKLSGSSWSLTIYFYDVLTPCYIVPQEMTVKINSPCGTAMTPDA